MTNKHNFAVPPVTTIAWDDATWSRWIDATCTCNEHKAQRGEPLTVLCRHGLVIDPEGMPCPACRAEENKP